MPSLFMLVVSFLLEYFALFEYHSNTICALCKVSVTVLGSYHVAPDLCHELSQR